MCFYQCNFQIKKFAEKFLQVQGKECSLLINKKNYGDKSTSLFTSKLLCGSITLEAAVVLPIFILVMAGMLYYSLIFNFQVMINENMWNTAKRTISSTYSGNTKQENDGIFEAVSKLYRNSQILDKDIKAIMKALGIHYVNIDLKHLDEGNNSKVIYDMRMDYYVSIPMVSSHVIGLNMRSRCYYRGFVGERMKETGEDTIVYVAQHGSVYHLFEDCPHISITMINVPYSKINLLRNISGETYKPCELCENKPVNNAEIVIITKNGNRYHSRNDCRGIKRLIKKVKKEHIEAMSICKTCKERSGEK